MCECCHFVHTLTFAIAKSPVFMPPRALRHAFHPRHYCILTISHNPQTRPRWVGGLDLSMMAEAEHWWTQRTKGAASYERVVDAKYLEEIRAAAK